MPTSTSMNTGRNRIAAQRRQSRRLAARQASKEAALLSAPKPLHKRRKAQQTKRERHQAMAALRKTGHGKAADVAQAKPAVPSFPAGLVAPRPLGVAIESVIMPAKLPPLASSAKAQTTPKAPSPSPAGRPATAKPPKPALPLPRLHEPLVTTDTPPPRQPRQQAPATPSPDVLPRNRALTRQNNGLVAAISAWLSSFGKMLASGFMKKKPRRLTYQPAIPQRGFPQPKRTTASTPSLRDKVEVTQLRAENRRLRSRLEEIEEARLAMQAETD